MRRSFKEIMSHVLFWSKNWRDKPTMIELSFLWGGMAWSGLFTESPSILIVHWHCLSFFWLLLYWRSCCSKQARNKGSTKTFFFQRRACTYTRNNLTCLKAKELRCVWVLLVEANGPPPIVLLPRLIHFQRTIGAQTQRWLHRPGHQMILNYLTSENASGVINMWAGLS